MNGHFVKTPKTPTMKKLLFSLCLLLTGSTTLYAQSFSMGARAGLNFAKETVTGSGASISGITKTSFLLGGYAKYMFTDKIGFQPEFFYSSLGTRSDPIIENLNYLSIPVMLRYNVTENVHFLAGPQLSILVSAKEVSDGRITDIKNHFKPYDLSVTLGVGVDFGPFNAGLRYCIGMLNISNDAPTGFMVRNNAFQIVGGYKLFGK